MIFFHELDNISTNLVHCKNCTECCKDGGPVYVLKSEVDMLNKLHVPLFNYSGHHFVRRKQNGHCYMLSTDEKECRIYNQRPTSCRLFPLDIFRYPEPEPKWVLFNYCPTNNRPLALLQNGQPSEMDLALSIVSKLEKLLPPKILHEIILATETVGDLDIFERHRSDAKIIRDVSVDYSEA